MIFYKANKNIEGVKPVVHSEIELKQNIETAWNIFRRASASLAYVYSHVEKYANEAR